MGADASMRILNCVTVVSALRASGGRTASWFKRARHSNSVWVHSRPSWFAYSSSLVSLSNPNL